MVVLRKKNYAVTYLPERGMNMVSFKKGDLEVIDQSTKEGFEKHSAGLGALIGPHFYQRSSTAKQSLPHTSDHADRFTHGIGRYAPWKFEATEDSITATLSGKDEWEGFPLSKLEGQNFKMEFRSRLEENGLHIRYSVVSDTDSIVGLHYYYRLPAGRGKVFSGVKPDYYDPNVKRPIPKEWLQEGKLAYTLDKDTDFAFHPYPNPLAADILLDAETYRLRVRYSNASEENAWQLYHPKGASFVCIEPCTAQDPRHANLTVSSMDVHLEILD